MRFNIDEIARMSNDELEFRLRESRNQARDEYWNAEIQQDYCYFYREAEIRDQRRSAWDAYLARRGQAQGVVEAK